MQNMKRKTAQQVEEACFCKSNHPEVFREIDMRYNFQNTRSWKLIRIFLEIKVTYYSRGNYLYGIIFAIV
jgi:hypothetical protein